MTTNAFLLCNVQTMMSLEIAELTSKQRKHVMEAIRRMEPAWVKVNGSNFRLVEYRDKKGSERVKQKLQEVMQFLLFFIVFF